MTTAREQQMLELLADVDEQERHRINQEHGHPAVTDVELPDADFIDLTRVLLDEQEAKGHPVERMSVRTWARLIIAVRNEIGWMNGLPGLIALPPNNGGFVATFYEVPVFESPDVPNDELWLERPWKPGRPTGLRWTVPLPPVRVTS